MYDPTRHEIAFLWQGRRNRRNAQIDVVYEHPTRDITLISHDDAHTSEHALKALGWEQLAVDGQRGFWTRDRLAATRAALERLDRAAPRAELTDGRHQARPPDGPKPAGPDLAV